MRALLATALVSATALDLITLYLLGWRRPAIKGAWKIAETILVVVWLGFGLAVLTHPDFPVWVLILLLVINALDGAARNYFLGIRRRDA
jgi:uncharacterized membrane protein YsdA (DUF1294 family)